MVAPGVSVAGRHWRWGVGSAARTAGLAAGDREPAREILDFRDSTPVPGRN